MRAYFWYAFVPGACTVGLDCFGTYWGQIRSACGCRTEDCFEVLAGPEMAPYPFHPSEDADTIPF